MKKIILCVVMLLLSCSLFATSAFRPDPNKYSIERINKEIEGNISEKKFNEELLDNIDELSFYGYSNFAYDICDRIKSLTIDEQYLKMVKIHQSVALVRILVENGVIETIYKIPEESLGIFNHKPNLFSYYIVDITEDIKARRKKEIYEILTADDHPEKISLEIEGINLENYETYIEETTEKTTSKIPASSDTVLAENLNSELPDHYANHDYTMEKSAEISPEKLSINHSRLLAQAATIALAEKYPIATEKFFDDYFTKYEISYPMTKIIINYLINKGEYDKAINLCEFFINEIKDTPISLITKPKSKLEILIAIAYAKSGNIEPALQIIDNFLNNLSSEIFLIFEEEQKINYYANKILMYKYADENKYEKEIDDLKNEIIITEKEKNNSYRTLETLNSELDTTRRSSFNVEFSYSRNIVREVIYITLTNMQRTSF